MWTPGPCVVSPVIIHEKLEICRNSIINIALIRRLVTELEELIMINQTDKFLNLGKYLATERRGYESFGSSEPSTTRGPRVRRKISTM